MPRPTNFVAFIRNVVREQVQEAIQGLLGGTARPRKKAANGRRRRRRGRGAGRPPGLMTWMRGGRGIHSRSSRLPREGRGGSDSGRSTSEQPRLL